VFGLRGKLAPFLSRGLSAETAFWCLGSPRLEQHFVPSTGKEQYLSDNSSNQVHTQKWRPTFAVGSWITRYRTTVLLCLGSPRFDNVFVQVLDYQNQANSFCLPIKDFKPGQQPLFIKVLVNSHSVPTSRRCSIL